MLDTCIHFAKSEQCPALVFGITQPNQIGSLTEGDRYSYAGDNPVDFADPSGNDIFSDFLTAAAEFAHAPETTATGLEAGAVVGGVAAGVYGLVKGTEYFERQLYQSNLDLGGS
jgi:hypothetical protein